MSESIEKFITLRQDVFKIFAKAWNKNSKECDKVKASDYDGHLKKIIEVVCKGSEYFTQDKESFSKQIKENIDLQLAKNPYTPESSRHDFKDAILKNTELVSRFMDSKRELAELYFELLSEANKVKKYID